MKGMTKVITIAMALILASGCSFGGDSKDPVLLEPAFDIIGDQGIKTSVTLTELQGDYAGKIWFEEHNESLYSDGSYDCTGSVEGNALTLYWEMDGKQFRSGEGIVFHLQDGIMKSAEEPHPKLICAVKVYPSGHMVDGLAVLVIDDGRGDTEVMVHFQLIR
ncbi:hypothetical protein [Youngiibacter fragilis]|uniref:Uncharacterized protein n=1 Tax=Youngiibacter fragilis 232.1 TaxID=994573 RepID=V7IAV2_9CLOT|nr:hypothetical protein [Youngiibacter fragilis]ETA82474.1 hypothetical protein T472_0200880 [Youngiibacter fragilis 232.1]